MSHWEVKKRECRQHLTYGGHSARALWSYMYALFFQTHCIFLSEKRSGISVFPSVGFHVYCGLESAWGLASAFWGALRYFSLSFFPHPITRKPQANFGHWDVSLPEIQSSGTFSPRREALMKLLRGNVQPREALFWKTRGSWCLHWDIFPLISRNSVASLNVSFSYCFSEAINGK